LPEPLAEALQQVGATLGEHFQQHPLETGPLMQFYFELLALLRVLDSFGPHSLCDLQRAERAPTPIAADAPVTLSLLDEPAPAADL
ncbi:hypothetical protein ABTH75_18845, partial [Acinetobacter baumannii]